MSSKARAYTYIVLLALLVQLLLEVLLADAQLLQLLVLVAGAGLGGDELGPAAGQLRFARV